MIYKYSIIIPQKNIPQLLARCLNSIPLRDDIQIIVVDDASDNPQEVQRVVTAYRNVELVLTTEKKGAGYARNQGLKLAKGDWLLFADADDFFSTSFERLVDKHYTEKSDIVFFAADSVYNDSLAHSPRLDNRIAAQRRYETDSKKMDEFCRYFHTEPWGKMIKRSLIERYNIRFDETPLANDFFFSVVSAYYADTIAFDNQVIYYYTERKGSLSYNYSGTKETVLTRLKVYLRVQQFFDEHGVPYSPFYRYSFSLYCGKNTGATDVVKEFWKKNHISFWYSLYRYVKEKIHQYTTGVRL